MPDSIGLLCSTSVNNHISSATADKPRDALYQSNFCQLNSCCTTVRIFVQLIGITGVRGCTVDRRVIKYVLSCVRSASTTVDLSHSLATRSMFRDEVQSFRQISCRGKCPYFGKYRNFLITLCRTGRRKLRCQNPARSIHSVVSIEHLYM